MIFYMLSILKMRVEIINRNQYLPFVLNIHYAHRCPSISYAYWLFDWEELIWCCTFWSPASPSLVKWICWWEYKKDVIELNRLVLKYNRKNEASYLVWKSLKLLPKPKIVVSYADTQQNHIWVVYQATNFLFTGTSKPRTDIDTGEKHSRHYEWITDYSKRKARSAKHRYIIIMWNTKIKTKIKKLLKYPILPYPKNK